MSDKAPDAGATDKWAPLAATVRDAVITAAEHDAREGRLSEADREMAARTAEAMEIAFRVGLASAEADGRDNSCSFCNRSSVFLFRSDPQLTGPAAWICEECVPLFNEVLLRERAKD